MHIKIIAIVLAVLLGGCSTFQKVQSTTNSDISILPGSKIFAEATINQDGSVELTKVDEIKNPEVTITFNLTEMKSGMMLSVKNPLDKTIKYHLNMIDYKGKSHNTSSCPVRAGLSVFESWPHSIPEILVSNTHVASKDEEGLCVY